MKIKKQLIEIKSFYFLLMFFISCGIFAQETTENSVSFTENDSNLEWGPCPDFMPEGCNIAVLHGNPAEKNTDIFFKVPANASIPNHTHTSPERMILVSGEMEVTYEGEQPQTLKEGTYAYGPANKPHSAKCGDSPCVLFIAFEDPVDAMPVEKD
ncbi:cupin domain-containing protein [Salegentibacter salarius]|uniref:Cupin n=1 Tax=Salegentibacter salarius TaxID=435906 RepID=A0A2N0TT78_9FLAO|nr:cupin domain-containing protein [Salegentibacter salarius]OEY72076.1 cupin [Salegentibacter salarius]PKD17888.1 cupin [Salegentibacter salarius]SLK05065.1 Cupin domain protein [Salegentibacter salarius]